MQFSRVPQEKRDLLEEKLDDTIKLIESRYPTLPPIQRPTLLFNLIGNTAGYAVGAKEIRLNHQLVNDPRYFEDMLNDTLPHEVCHIACQQWWPRKKVGHGLLWKQMMGCIGLSPTRCHQYETVSARQTYEYHCGCQTHKVSSVRHNRMQNGKNYICRNCGQRIRR